MQDLHGEPSPLTCPDCDGSLWEIMDGRLVRYQCHTGHQFAPESLQSEQREAVDSALWNAVRVLEEHSELKMRLARRAEAGGLTKVSAGFEVGARDARRQAQQIRALLVPTANAGGGNTAAPLVGPATSPPRRRRAAARNKAKATRARKKPRR